MPDFSNWIYRRVSNAPLIIFRLAFGGLLLFSTLRTFQKGWIKELYIDPEYHFAFFSWLKPLGAEGMYVVFGLMAVAAIGIIMGLFYRFSVLLFLVLFTYTELLDKTYYLNHYYLASLLTFWLLVVPAHRRYSLDALLFPSIRSTTCANWHIQIFKIQLSIVYFFAGLAKVNPDWLLKAQPLATWLPGKYQLPIIGQFVHLKSVAFLFSWAGCIYDLTIWVFLWMKRSRSIAYVFVLGFHILTGILFPRIGMFPYIMITATIIFFSPTWHEKVLSMLPFSGGPKTEDEPTGTIIRKPWVMAALGMYIAVQLFLPFRYLQYPGNLFWHEQGYRFSWRVMLMEKNGYTSIIVRDPSNNVQKEVDQDQYLTAFQKQQMRSQPDMILQFARHIGDEFVAEHGYAPEIFVESRLSMNGRRSQPFTDPAIDVYTMDETHQKQWLQPLKN